MDLKTDAPHSWHSDGPGKNCHCTVSGCIGLMSLSSALPAPFWPHAFHHFIILNNITPHSEDPESPCIIICSGHIPNISFCPAFGCGVCCLPPCPHHPLTLNNHFLPGCFLGHSNTARNILCHDLESNGVEDSQHIACDEAHCVSLMLFLHTLTSLVPLLPLLMPFSILTMKLPLLGHPGLPLFNSPLSRWWWHWMSLGHQISPLPWSALSLNLQDPSWASWAFTACLGTPLSSSSWCLCRCWVLWR